MLLTVAAAPNLVGCALDDEAVLLNVETGTYYGLNSVGRRVWQLVQRPRTIAAVRDTLVAEFDVPPERCERDLVSLLAELQQHGLVQVTDANAHH
jgi:hypothetical protein